jgi:ABC-2 type transport system permease protein
MNIWHIFRRELAGYFVTPVAYVFLVIFLALAGAFTFYLGNFFERGQADLQPFFLYHVWLYLLLVPAVAMRLWAEERKAGTIELLSSSSVWRSPSPSRCGSPSTFSASRTMASYSRATSAVF